MEKSNKKDSGKKKDNQSTTFPVPFPLGKMKENLTFNSNSASKEKLINQAFKFHSQGNISEAAKSYQHFLDQGYTDPGVFSNYGIICRGKGKNDLAKKLYLKSIRLYPDHSESYSNLGFLFKEENDLERALKYINKAIKLNPDNSSAHLNLGWIMKDLGKSKEAELSTRKAIELNPNFANAHYNLGIILDDLGKLEESEISYRKAISINPNFANAYCNLGGILKNLGKLKEAEISTRKAIKINPNFGDANFNLGLILNDLGKLKELIYLSKSTIESKSINEGYKLRALLNLVIANLLQQDFSGTLLNINKINDLISKGVVNSIRDVKNRRHTSNYSRFITSLYPLLEKENPNPNAEKIPHIGESHCLSFAHQTLSISSQVKKIQPVLITGGKAWHFAKHGNNQWKDSLTQQIKNHTYSEYVFISFGEIDCRKNEGILPYTSKTNKNILEVCEKTINGYLDYMEATLSNNYSKRYYFGIPAPTRKKELPEKLDIKRIEIIKIFNSLLKKEVLSRQAYFIDVYELTSTIDGVNNNIHMCDTNHLSPKCLSILFKNHLYEPDI